MEDYYINNLRIPVQRARKFSDVLGTTLEKSCTIAKKVQSNQPQTSDILSSKSLKKVLLFSITSITILSTGSPSTDTSKYTQGCLSRLIASTIRCFGHKLERRKRSRISSNVPRVYVSQTACQANANLLKQRAIVNSSALNTTNYHHLPQILCLKQI